MKKKWMALCLAAVMATGMMGCQPQNNDQTANQTPPTEQVSDLGWLVHNTDGTMTVTDSTGREVVLPEKLTQIAPSGTTAQMILYTLVPDLMVGWGKTPSKVQQKYIPEKYYNLPEFGQFYGKNASLNMEALIAAKPQVIIDMGDMKKGHKEDMDRIQEQTGIPAIFIEANLDNFAAAYRMLGELFGVQDAAEKLAKYIDETVQTAQETAAKIPADARVSVMFGTGETGLDVNAKGSIHSAVIDLIGADNAIEVAEVSNKGGGNTISMETVLMAQPDVIVFSAGAPYDTVASDENWSSVKAVQEGKYYQIPAEPYNWLTEPPSVNRIIGARWLGNLLYPELYPYDMIEETKNFYELFWHYSLTDEEAKQLLAKSTFKS